MGRSLTKQLFTQLVLGLFIICFACNVNTGDKQIQTQTNSQQMTITVDTMKQLLNAFNRHDLDAIMEYFSNDCTFDFPRGPEPYGQRFVGKAQVREGLASRF